MIPTFHYSLRPGGYLFLGTSENITQHADLFSPVDRKTPESYPIKLPDGYDTWAAAWRRGAFRPLVVSAR